MKHNIAFPRIHDSLKLLDLVLPVAPEFEKYRLGFAELSGYAIEVGYPGEMAEPSREEAIRACDCAEEVFGEVQSFLIS